jgi:hypothetical protein
MTASTVDVEHETEHERAFYETCRVGDTSYQCITDVVQHQTCGIRVVGILYLYCTRRPGHDDTRHVAEGITDVLAVSAER